MTSAAEAIQVLFSADEVVRLQQLAVTQNRSVDSLVRQAVTEKYLDDTRFERLAAVRQLAELNLPVSDWEQMERESTTRSTLE
jgi:predicted transcriptional regulator